MRKRTDIKRETILNAATQAFMEMGYDKTSMAEIAVRANCSKVTLYGYFPSKEELFLGAISLGMETDICPTLANLTIQTTDSPLQVLTQFGQSYLTVALKPEATALRRLAITLITDPDIAARFGMLGPQRFFNAIEAYLSTTTKAGYLTAHNPVAAAQHLIALYESETGGGGIFMDTTHFTPELIQQLVDRAVDIFLAKYGVPLTK